MEIDPKDSEEARDFEKVLGLDGPYKFPLGPDDVECWMRHLVGREIVHVHAIWKDTYDAQKALNCEEQSCRLAASMAVEIGMILISLRVGKGGEALFKTPEEVYQIPAETRRAIMGEYSKRFDMTEEEVGKSLRARIGSSRTRSNSPATSQA